MTVPEIISHFEEVIRALPTPPIIMGHSAGGAFTQILLDHGFGAAGVAINSAPTEGVKITPPSQLKEYPGFAHLLPAQQGWEEIADYALDWAVKQAR